MNEYRYYIKNTYQPVSDIVVLELADIRGVPVFDFRPGQYVMLGYRNSAGKLQEKHTFSIASSPMKKDSIRLGIRILGKFTTGLLSLKVGQEVFISGPFGSFVFDEHANGEAVFIAGGVGITPFISSLAYAVDKRLPNKLTLMYSSRTMQGAVFADEIIKMTEGNDNIRAIFSVTDEKLSRKYSNVMAEKINTAAIRGFVGHPYGKTFFLCGPVPFMDAMRRDLSELGVREAQIRTEEFSMMPDTSLWLRSRNMAYAVGLATAIFALIFYTIQNFGKQGNVNSAAVTDNMVSNQPSNTGNGSAGTNQVQQPQQTSVPVIPAPSRRTRTS